MAQEPRRSDTLEVELKYPVTDFRSLRQRLEELGAQRLPGDWETDLYYTAPDRSFVVTDEALRLRRTRDRLWLTYKGPRCDPLSKTRSEIEVELHSPSVFDQACALLEHLGYRPIASIWKDRSCYHLDWEGYAVKVALDDVQYLGRFVELETIVPHDHLEPARKALEELAQRLGLSKPERRSYLELYLEYLRSLPYENFPPTM